MKVRIDYAICNSCGLCREVCPESAIRPTLLEPRHLYEVQEAKCTGCGECLEYCPAPGALVQYECTSGCHCEEPSDEAISIESSDTRREIASLRSQ